MIPGVDEHPDFVNLPQKSKRVFGGHGKVGCSVGIFVAFLVGTFVGEVDGYVVVGLNVVVLVVGSLVGPRRGLEVGNFVGEYVGYGVGPVVGGVGDVVPQSPLSYWHSGTLQNASHFPFNSKNGGHPIAQSSFCLQTWACFHTTNPPLAGSSQHGFNFTYAPLLKLAVFVGTVSEAGLQ